MATARASVSVEEARAEGIDPDVFARRWIILGVLCASLLAVVLANGSLNLALPSLARDLDATQLELTWIVEAFILVFACLLMVAAALADRFGRARSMQIGLGVYALAAAYAALIADSSMDVIGSRAVMGLGAAFVMPNTLSIVNVVFPRRERPRAIAIWAAVSSAGFMASGVITGLLLEVFSWHSVFVLSGVLAVVALVGNWWMVPNSRDESRTRVDVVGGVLVTAALVGIVYGIMQASHAGFSAPQVLASWTIGALALAAFIAWERHTPAPLLDLTLFRDPAFAISALAITLAFFAMMNAFFSNSQIFQLVLGFTPLESAISFIPIMLPMVLLTPYVPNISARLGTKWTVAPGLALVGVGFVLMALWPTSVQYWQVAGAMFILIVGMALAMTPSTSMLMSAVPRQRSGMGSGMNNTTRQVGGAFGIAVLGSFVSAGYNSRMAEAAGNVPGADEAIAQGSLAGGLEVAAAMGPDGAALATTAVSAYMQGNSIAMLVGAVFAFAAAGIAAAWMPHQEDASAPGAAQSPTPSVPLHTSPPSQQPSRSTSGAPGARSTSGAPGAPEEEQAR